jgi:nitrogen fixation NifU-like protein
VSLDELYGEIILDHYKNPRNAGEMEDPSIKSQGFNQSCGDDITIFVRVDENGRISGIRFSGHGCAISQSSASMMTERMRGKTLEEAEEFISRMRKMLTGGGDFSELGEYDELSALRGVTKFPMRVKCASLAWTTLETGIEEFRGEGRANRT